MPQPPLYGVAHLGRHYPYHVIEAIPSESGLSRLFAHLERKHNVPPGLLHRRFNQALTPDAIWSSACSAAWTVSRRMLVSPFDSAPTPSFW
jgi:hypothetical protein